MYTTNRFDGCDLIYSYAELYLSRYSLECTDIPNGLTITLTEDYLPGQVELEVSPISKNIYKGFLLEYYDFIFLVTEDAMIGEVSISVRPEDYTVPTGTDMYCQELYRIYSINSIDESEDTNELNDKVFSSSLWTTNRITSRQLNFSVSGILIKQDYGLENIKQGISQNGKHYFNLYTEQDSIYPVQGVVQIKQYTEARNVDNNIEVSFDLVISKTDNLVPETEVIVIYLQDENLAIIVDEALQNIST